MSPEIHLLGMWHALTQNRTELRPGLRPIGNETQKETPGRPNICPQVPLLIPFSRNCRELFPSPPPSARAHLVLTKGFGDISWTRAASVLSRGKARTGYQHQTGLDHAIHPLEGDTVTGNCWYRPAPSQAPGPTTPCLLTSFAPRRPSISSVGQRVVPPTL
jgi:hypothetical protein